MIQLIALSNQQYQSYGSLSVVLIVGSLDSFDSFTHPLNLQIEFIIHQISSHEWIYTQQMQPDSKVCMLPGDILLVTSAFKMCFLLCCILITIHRRAALENQ